MSEFKIIITGNDVETQDRFAIVKSGEYSVNSAGFIKALKDGIFDKYRRQAPEFTCVRFKTGHSFIRSGKKLIPCFFTLVEHDIEDPSETNTLKGTALFQVLNRTYSTPKKKLQAS